MEWTMQPVLDHLKARMQRSEAGTRDWELLAALAAAMSDPAKLPGLGRFPAWREARPQPLD
jgi:hypothetical protein